MTPLFSVVVPSYNRATMLKTALETVALQTLPDFECFVLDDGSTDSTPAVFDQYRKDARFKLHRFEDNRRQHVRRNFAVRQAQGRFVTFLDSDDLWLPDRLDVFAKAMERRPNVDWWFSNAWVLREGRIIGTLFDPDRPIEEGVVPGWYAVGDRRLPYLTSNLAVRRELFTSVGLFREDMRILEDTELYARMLAAGANVGALRRPLAVRRLHEAQITGDHERLFTEARMALLAGGAAGQTLERETEALAYEVAGYLLKSLKPEQARRFLREKTGKTYWLSFVPRPLLAAAKALRRSALRSAPGSEDVLKFIEPLLSKERAAEG